MLDDYEKGLHSVRTPGAKQKLTIINECCRVVDAGGP
jgi:hypothetical protein